MRNLELIRHDDVKYNAKKSAVMIYKSMTLKGCTIHNFKLNGMILHVVASYKYLGHYITDYLSDDDDINRQRRTLFKGILYCESLICVPWV